MTNKKIKYFLIFGTVLVWALVLYNIIQGLSKDEPGKSSNSNQLTMADYTVKNDSFFLFADYPDPFIPEIDTLQQQIDEIDKQLNVQNGNLTTNHKIASVPIKTDLNFIRYLGTVINKDVKNKKAGFINLRGKDIMVKEGQKIDDIVIKKIEKDRLHFLYQNKKQTVFYKIQ